MQSSATVVLNSTRKRPLAISIFAALLVFLGAVQAALGALAFWFHTSVQVVVSPFRHNMYVFFKPWALLMLLVGFGIWFTWTGRRLWRMRRIAQRSAQCILGLILLRGLLVLIPPLEDGELAFAIWVIMGTCFGFTLLWHYSRVFK